MTVGVTRDNISIVLQRPKQPENIGAAARAMCNMGFTRLIVVAPDLWETERMRRLATHAAASVVDGIRRFDSLSEALAPFGHVIGTTARLGNQRPVIQSPECLARNLIPLSRNNPVAILFGPEDRGLSNEDLKRCHQLVTIPTAKFASLNLAQAVMVICYCLSSAGLPDPPPATPRLAKRIELDRMFDEITATLVAIGYVNPQNPDYWMTRVRRFLTRLSLRAGEVSTLRGVCRQISHYGDQRYTDGLKAGKSGRT